MYIKAKSNAFPSLVPPYQGIQLCHVMLALNKDGEMRFVKSWCDTFKYDCKISAECPLLKGNDDDSDDDLDGYTWRCHLKTNKSTKYRLPHVHSKYIYHFGQLTRQIALFFYVDVGGCMCIYLLEIQLHQLYSLIVQLVEWIQCKIH